MTSRAELPARPGGMSLPLRAALRWFSPAGSRARLSVLIFHRVRSQPDPVFPAGLAATAFRERMLWLRELFNVIPLDEAVMRLAAGTLPERAAAVTFDDGYADNVSVALPILRELGLHATFFISSGFIDGGRMWNDTVKEVARRAPGPELDATSLGLGRHAIGDAAARRAASATLIRALKYRPSAERSEQVRQLESLAGVPLADDLMMTSAQVRELAAAGMGIGGHTLSHPILTRLAPADAEREIAEGRERLEAIAGQRVPLFAYPNGKPGGDYGRVHAEIVARLGFRAAFTTAPGSATQGIGLHELPRFTPWARTPLHFGLRMLRNLRKPVQRAAA